MAKKQSQHQLQERASWNANIHNWYTGKLLQDAKRAGFNEKVRELHAMLAPLEARLHKQNVRVLLPPTLPPDSFWKGIQ